ncbi:MAG: PhoX family phosphatase [Planctomycetota bacterium]
MFEPTSPLDRITATSLSRRTWLSTTSALAALFGLDRARSQSPKDSGSAGRPPATLSNQAGSLVDSQARADGPAHFAFAPVAASHDDAVRVPAGYRCRVFFPWGTPVRPGGPEWTPRASAADQREQAGMHHDGMAFFPADPRWNAATCTLEGSSTRGFLAINHEYTDEGLLHPDGVQPWTADKVRKSKAAVGVSILAIEKTDGEWHIRSGRRVTGHDRIEIAGPARGHALLRTHGAFDQAYEKDGTATDGTFANCANGRTPWGTYLTCEENVQDYFARTPKSGRSGGEMDAAERIVERRFARYGIGAAESYVPGWRSTYGWDRFDPRFDADKVEYRNHCHRYGWVVEIDPRDPDRPPCKRTALGRFRHENAAVVVAPDMRVVVYMGDDARFEYVYKFVSTKAFEPELEGDDDAARARKREHNWTLLDEGKLYVARFDSGDTGRWLELSVDDPAIAHGGEFGSQPEVLVFARRAADLVAATKMDRPEWIAADQDARTRQVRNVYVSLTNNSKRGVPGNEGPTPANPRADNIYGHIARFRETGGDPTATTFQWSLFVLCGYRKSGLADRRGNIKDAPGCADQDFASPDGLTMDPRGGVLWVQTDVSTSLLQETPFEKLGNNQMLAIDVATGEARRFLTGPRGCEITGVAFTPDCRTMFVNIQHPGELAESFGDPKTPTAVSKWPNGDHDGRPRSATLVITRDDGQPIGT